MTDNIKSVLLGLAIAIVSSTALPTASADESNKETIVTFSQPVEVPGRILPAGTYVFKLANIGLDRDMVQIFTADQKHLLDTISAVPAQRAEASHETTITFEERGDGIQAIQKWFYPDETDGLEFIYRGH